MKFLFLLWAWSINLFALEDPFGPQFLKRVEEIHGYFDSLPARHSDLVHKTKLMKTTNGYDLSIFTLGKVDAKRRVLLLCNHHGDEQWVAQLCVDFTKYLLFSYPNSPWLKEWFSDTALDILPIGNPDGFAKGSRYTAKGNDINRNFPFMWNYVEEGTVNTRPGPHALSEGEATALHDYQLKHDGEWILILNYHLSYPDSGPENYILLPWAYTRKKELSAAEMDQYWKFLPNKAEAPTFSVDTIPNVFYPCSGTHTDWSWERFRAPAMTMELGHGYTLPTRSVYLEKFLKEENLPVFLRFLRGVKS